MTAPPEGQGAGHDDVRGVAACLERRYPGAMVWYGQFTAAWWAMVPLDGGIRLVEATSPQQLQEAITDAARWPWPRQ